MVKDGITIISTLLWLN